jgi:hypothetical protein
MDLYNSFLSEAESTLLTSKPSKKLTWEEELAENMKEMEISDEEVPFGVRVKRKGLTPGFAPAQAFYEARVPAFIELSPAAQLAIYEGLYHDRGSLGLDGAKPVREVLGLKDDYCGAVEAFQMQRITFVEYYEHIKEEQDRRLKDCEERGGGALERRHIITDANHKLKQYIGPQFLVLKDADKAKRFLESKCLPTKYVDQYPFDYATQHKPALPTESNTRAEPAPQQPCAPKAPARSAARRKQADSIMAALRTDKTPNLQCASSPLHIVSEGSSRCPAISKSSGDNSHLTAAEIADFAELALEPKPRSNTAPVTATVSSAPGTRRSSISTRAREASAAPSALDDNDVGIVPARASLRSAEMIRRPARYSLDGDDDDNDKVNRMSNGNRRSSLSAFAADASTGSAAVESSTARGSMPPPAQVIGGTRRKRKSNRSTKDTRSSKLNDGHKV